MSSQLNNARFSSSVYRASLTITASFILLAIVLLWSLYHAGLTIEHQAVKSQLQDDAEYFIDTYNTSGLEGVIEAISIDGDSEWTEDEIHTSFDDDEYVLSLYHKNQFIAGYSALSIHSLEHPNTIILDVLDDEDFDVQPLFKTRLPLSADSEIIIARFVPEVWEWRKEYITIISFTLLIVLMPISLLSANVLSRRVAKRFNKVSSVLATVGNVSMQNRLPVSKKQDEFDHLSNSINQMLDRVAQLTRNIENTSVGIAHDLKTPISNVSGRLQLMERDINEPDLVQMHIHKAQENIGNLLRTLDALLRLGEVEAGKRRGAFKPTNLSGIAIDLAESFQPVLEEADKQFNYDIEPQLYVHGDTDLLVQLLSNLLENAVEHTRDGGAITLVLKQTHDLAELRLIDDGPGIAAHDAVRIFDRFHRADASRGSQGNGLGLSLVRAITELHSGHVKLLTENGGSTFVICLPLLKQ